MPDLTSLTSDGDTLKLDDERMLRLKIEPDQDYSINDYDSDGKIEWSRQNDYGSVRPAGFSGRARIIKHHHWQDLWWEPYELTEEQIAQEMPRIVNLIEYGFNGVTLELCEDTDAYGEPIVTKFASLWGIEWDADRDYIRSIVSDLADELEVQLA